MSVLRQITPVENPIVETERLRKVYGSGDVSVTALNDVDVTFGRGQFTAIMGPSGSGKSTLMHCTAGLDSISSGIVKVNGALISSMNPGQRTTFRRDQVGFIFQAFNLIPSLSALENITLPSDIAGRKIDKDRFDAVISALGIGNRLNHRPAELSGGQQQRVACARALVADAAVVFADEPTGNLDSEATDSVLGFIRYAVDQLGQSVIMVTHEPTAAAWADRVVFLRDGNVHAEMVAPDTDSILDALRTFTAHGHDHEPGAALGLGAGHLGQAGQAGQPWKAGLAHGPAAGHSSAVNPHLDVAQPAATPLLLDPTEAGETAFAIPGLGKVVVSGDVHVHVYDQEPRSPEPHSSEQHSPEQHQEEAHNEGSHSEESHNEDPYNEDPWESPIIREEIPEPEDSPFIKEDEPERFGSPYDDEDPHAMPKASGPYMPVEQYGFVRGEE